MKEVKLVLINLEEDKEHPAMGLISIATYLENNGFNNTTIIDRCFEDVPARIAELNPTVVGISSKTVHYALAMETAQQIRERFPNIMLIVGGPHITTLPPSLKVFDFGVIGEGEETVLEIIKSLEKDKLDLSKIKGLVYNKNNKICITEPRPPIMPLDSIPSPNLKYVNPKFIREMNSGFGLGKRGFIITSRGCPFRCLYCSTTRVWSKLRFNSPERIVHDIKDWVEKYGVTQIRVMDDLFVISVERMLEIEQLMEKEGLMGKVGFIVSARANVLNEELCKICKRIGVKKMNFGFDSGNERVLKMLKGDAMSVSYIKSAVELCEKYGILMEGSFIFASPTETIAEMEDTLSIIKWMARKKNVDSVWTFVMTPLPATPIWDIAEKRGKVSTNMNWRDLSYYREHDPLVLDADYDEFRELWTRVKTELKVFKWHRIQKMILTDPLYLIKKSFAKPKLLFNLIFYRRVVDQENIKEK